MEHVARNYLFYKKKVRLLNLRWGRLTCLWIDYYAIPGTPIYAIGKGTIVDVDNVGNSDYGKTVTLEITQDDCSKIYAFYAHLSSATVKVGQNVGDGEEIGATGNTGNASSMKGVDQHLHFEIRTQRNCGLGLKGRQDPNDFVDTKFVIDPDDPTKVNMVDPVLEYWEPVKNTYLIDPVVNCVPDKTRVDFPIIFSLPEN